MKTSTVLLVVVVVFLWQSGAFAATSRPAPTVSTPPPPQRQTNPGGDTFGQIMQAITAVSGAVKSGIDASTDRGG